MLSPWFPAWVSPFFCDDKRLSGLQLFSQGDLWQETSLLLLCVMAILVAKILRQKMKDAEKFIQNSSELFRTCLVFLPAIVDHSYINIMLYIYIRNSWWLYSNIVRFLSVHTQWHSAQNLEKQLPGQICCSGFDLFARSSQLRLVQW